jgi:hypothetical protein
MLIQRNVPLSLRAFALLVLASCAGSQGAADPPPAGAEPAAPAVTPSVARVAAGPEAAHPRVPMSATGKLAAKNVTRWNAAATDSSKHADALTREHANCDNEPDCEPSTHDPDGALIGTRSETAIATDATGTHVVIGFNDFRGFTSTTTLSISGFAYSDDGGSTFVDGGQLPITTPTVTLNGIVYPQVFGDPDVKYLGGCNFVFSSILVTKFAADPNDTNVVQTMGYHLSNDCGHTWRGPFEVTAASNPSGTILQGGAPGDFADKELMDVDPDTGRVMMSWTDFTETDVEMSTTFSDNILSDNPTWSPRALVANGPNDGQGSIPRFAGRGSNDVYLAWARFPDATDDNIAFARSTDNGATWSAPIDLAAPTFSMDEILGNDRAHNFPWMAVDNSRGRHRGTIYVVYAPNDGHDGADIALQKSTDGGKTFSAPLKLNSRIGGDRAQWFPAVTVDSQTGRVYVFYYDQGIAKSGDLTETTYTFSDNGGRTWHRPRPLSERPWHAGYGNDLSQPNIGDYNESTSLGGKLYAVYAETHPIGFTDGEPGSVQFSVPAPVVKRVQPRAFGEDVTVQVGEVTFEDTGADGAINPNEIVLVQAPLVNYVTNPLNAAPLDELFASMTTSTPGVSVFLGISPYPRLGPGESQPNDIPFVLAVSSSFVPGTPIELELHVGQIFSAQTTLHVTLQTGTPVETVIFAENFDESSETALPPGWSSVHASGANTVGWVTSSSFCGATSPGAFHVEANDGPGGAPITRTERLFGPAMTVPTDSEYVTIDYDVCYDLIDDPRYSILAYDGMFLRIRDLNPADQMHTRSVLAEAFATDFTTGSINGYPRKLPRAFGDPDDLFEDMSVWSGDSTGFQHVHLRLPGMAGSTAALRFEYQQTAGAICSTVRPDHACGVLVDNIVVRSVVSKK